MSRVKLIAIALFFFLTFASSLGVAQEVSPRVVTLRQGQKAPFAGTLLNPAAAAHTIAEKENIVSQCKLTKDYIEQKEKARCDMLIGSIQASLDASRYKYDAITKIKDDEIERLSKIAMDQPNRYNHWWAAGGFVAGIITSVTIFYAAVEVTK